MRTNLIPMQFTHLWTTDFATALRLCEKSTVISRTFSGQKRHFSSGTSGATCVSGSDHVTPQMQKIIQRAMICW